MLRSRVILSAILLVLALITFKGLVWQKWAREYVEMDTVRELTFNDQFGWPHPYKLRFIPQYRFVHQVGEFLIRRDQHQQFVGGLAQSWTIAPDRKSITFHLRSGTYSSDEVVQSLKRLLKAHQTSHSNLAAQTSAGMIEAVGSDQVVIKTFGDAGAVLSPLVMADAAILPDDHWVRLENGDEVVDWTKSKGPYIYQSGRFPLKANQSIVFKPNPSHYFFSQDQLVWNIQGVLEEDLLNEENVAKLFDEKTPSFLTTRSWGYLKINHVINKVVPFYETKPNSIGFITLNLQKGIFADPKNRKAFIKTIFSSPLSVIEPGMRAFQVAQPGLTGRLPPEEEGVLLKEIQSYDATVLDNKPVTWLMPREKTYDQDWVAGIQKEIPLKNISKPGAGAPLSQDWKTGEYDCMIASIGMSDTDPISGATFFFSPKGAGIDLPNGELLKILNGAKDSTDRGRIATAVREAFGRALKEGLLVPLQYVSNRHYYSKNIKLNISDPFAESIKIWELRLLQPVAH